MTSERIKEIQETTAYPESTSVKQALLQVWNECAQESKIEYPKKLYSFVYCSCIHESVDATMSIHFTKEGAEIAMYIHKNEELKKFNEMFEREKDVDIEFGQHERWGIEEIIVLD